METIVIDSELAAARIAMTAAPAMAGGIAAV